MKPQTADVSAIHAVSSRTVRQEQNRLAKAAQRERAKVSGLLKIEIHLGAEDAALLTWLRTAQAGNPETFNLRALLVGAKFLYNAGNVRGGKKRIKGVGK